MGEVVVSEDQYIGGYDDSGRMHGIGTLTLVNGDKYTGSYPLIISCVIYIKIFYIQYYLQATGFMER